MRYLVLEFDPPTDPRRINLAGGWDALHAVASSQKECATEKQAAEYAAVRAPDGVGLLMRVNVGSGTSTVIVVVPDASKAISPEGEIPCVMLVQPMPSTDLERSQLRKGQAFQQDAWKLKPYKPDIHTERDIELRATDLQVPVFTKAKVGYRNGRCVIYVEVGGIEMSIEFRDRALDVVDVTQQYDAKAAT